MHLQSEQLEHARCTLCAGMVFNVSIGFSGLVNENEKEANAGKEHALFLGDLVLVNAQGPATALTTVKKRLKDIKLEIQVRATSLTDGRTSY